MSEFSVGSREWVNEIRLQLFEMNKEIDRTQLAMGSLMYKLSVTTVKGTHVDKDPDTAGAISCIDYADVVTFAQEELGWSYDRIHTMLNVYCLLEEGLLKDIDPRIKDALLQLGYTKLRFLRTVLTPKNVMAWLEKAAELTCAQLNKVVKGYRVQVRELEQKRLLEKGATLTPEQEDVVAHRLTQDEKLDVRDSVEVELLPVTERTQMLHFGLYADQVAVVNHALDTAQSIALSDKRSHLLTLICLDFLATNGGAKPGLQSFQTYIANIERIMGIKLVAIDTSIKKWNVLFGADTLGLFALNMEEEDA